MAILQYAMNHRGRIDRSRCRAINGRRFAVQNGQKARLRPNEDLIAFSQCEHCFDQSTFVQFNRFPHAEQHVPKYAEFAIQHKRESLNSPHYYPPTMDEM